MRRKFPREISGQYDNTMAFCLDDGARLLYGPASIDEPAAAILSEAGAPAPGFRPDEAQAHAQIDMTEKTVVLPGVDTDVPRGRSFDKRLLFARLALAAIVLGGFFGYRYSNAADSGQINSIAVLPFANATTDKETDFLSDGLAETLMNNFTRIPELKVTARSTAFSFRGREGEPLEVGRELNVGSMLTGRLMQRGDQLSIQIDLIDTLDGSQIWGNRYDGKTSDIVSIQQRIATDVSSQLRLKLTGAQEQQIAKTYTQNPEAYQHYLRGRFYWNKRTDESLRTALRILGCGFCRSIVRTCVCRPRRQLPATAGVCRNARQRGDAKGEGLRRKGTADRPFTWRAPRNARVDPSLFVAMGRGRSRVSACHRA